MTTAAQVPTAEPGVAPGLLRAFRKHGGVLFAALLLGGLCLSSLYSYLLFHTLAEMFSVAVAWGIFAVVWNSRTFHNSAFLLFVGIAYLFVGGLDLLHTLAYKGMGVFPADSADLPTQLWIAARYVESLSLLVAPFFLGRRARTPYLVVAAYVAVSVLALASIFVWHVFPTCYVEGIGLTPFKVASEYVIMFILLAAGILLLRQRRALDRGVVRLLLASIVLTIASELSFTLYVNVYGFFNLLGHVFKILSFYLIYKAFVQTGLTEPYDLLFRDLKQSEEALRRYAGELEARNEELDAFAHTVAHDLRTPLALIGGYAELAYAELNEISEWDESSRSYLTRSLETILRSSQHMSSIVDELLLLSGVSREAVQLAPLDMASIVAQALERLAHLIRDYEAEITLPESWPICIGYAPWIEEVWANYLSNGLRYGGRPPQLELGASLESASQPGTVCYWVRDNGPGIGLEDQARLFVPFAQLNESRSGGHGLGLSIVKRIVQKLGGQVGVESTPGQGSTFYFALPGPDGASL